MNDDVQLNQFVDQFIAVPFMGRDKRQNKVALAKLIRHKYQRQSLQPKSHPFSRMALIYKKLNKWGISWLMQFFRIGLIVFV